MHKMIFLLSLVIFIQGTLNAQSLYEVTTEEKTQNSTIIAEGKVVAKESFWNNQHSMIYTENKVLVYKLFKGNVVADTIKVLTVGGSVGNESIEASDLLQLNINDIGIFYCVPNILSISSPNSATVLLDIYSSSQGFLKYDINSQSASCPFKKFNNISTSFYQAIESQTGQRYRTIRNLSIDLEQNRATNITAPTINSFSPETVNAGALLDPSTNLLTINGSGFGSSPSGSAAVFFDNADDGTGGTPYSIAYNSALIVLWSDSQIQVRVPTKAGSGTFGVIDASGNQVSASTALNVSYSVITASFSSGTYIKEVNNVNYNGSGGYTIYYSSNTAGSGVDLNSSLAKATFQRALTAWKEISGYNIIEGGTSNLQAIAGDGYNVIMYDNTNTGISPLAAGVLAVCYSYFSICSDNYTLNQAIKREFDISIRNTSVSSGTSNFTLGPCPPNATDYTLTDLETVLLHELGHSIGLGHINDSYVGGIGTMNPGKLMNYAIVNSSKRVSPDYSAKTGAAYLIQQQGNTYGICGVTEMTPLSTTIESKDNCPTSLPSAALTNGTTVTFDLVHATSNKLTDPAYTNIRCDGVGASQTNSAYYAFKTNSTGGSMTINVSGYTTNPTSLTSCTQIYSGIPVTGIRLALYNVSGGLPTSPAGYTSLIACREFSGDGSLTSFSGLGSNTNYLLMVEGIENTKANFTFSFSGTAISDGANLPLSNLMLTGNADGKEINLQLTAVNEQDIRFYELERSADEISFSKFGEIQAISSSFVGNRVYKFIDKQPIVGKNYYRIKAISQNNQIQYSNIFFVNLNQKIASFSVTPNPIEGKQLELNVIMLKKGNYVFSVSDILGRVFLKKMVLYNGLSNIITEMLPSTSKSGIYFVKLEGEGISILKKFIIK
jgi:hypothetical protein